LSFLTACSDGSCLAIVEETQIWTRHPGGVWSLFAQAEIALQSLASSAGAVFAGGMNEAALLRVSTAGEVERLTAFDATPGREEWFAGGPPLGVRSLAATGDAVLAAVHVGGIPRSVDGGLSWAPTIPVMFDVHELSVNAALPSFAAAACAVGLVVSRNGGATWKLFEEGLDGTTSLAVAALAEETLFSVQDGPFATRSQVWRWRLGAGRVEQVRDGLPEWLDGKVDTGHIAAGAGRAAVADGGGSLWLSREGSRGWERVASDLGYVFGVAIVD
jgi:hypothetical protein